MEKLIKYDLLENSIKFNFDGVSSCIPKELFPLEVKIFNYINDVVIWETKVYDNYYAYFDGLFFNYVNIYTSDGKKIFSYNPKPENSSKLYQFFHLWCLTHTCTKGIAIGTHDGTFGEWVQSVVENRTNAVLVEGSETQFKTLDKNYKNKKNVKTINKVVTPKGGVVEFHEVDNNYGNSVYRENIEKLASGYEIKTIKKDSISLKELIEENFSTAPDWIHLDVEGLDSDLILEFEEFPYYLPKFFIYENNNLNSDQSNSVKLFLEKHGYNFINEDINTLAYR